MPMAVARVGARIVGRAVDMHSGNLCPHARICRNEGSLKEVRVGWVEEESRMQRDLGEECEGAMVVGGACLPRAGTAAGGGRHEGLLGGKVRAVVRTSRATAQPRAPQVPVHKPGVSKFFTR